MLHCRQLALCVVVASALSLSAAPCAQAEEGSSLPDRWIFWLGNLAPAESVTKLEELIRRAAKAGYTGIALNDSKMSHISVHGPEYLKNIERIKAVAKECNFEIIPGIFSVGYSNDLLYLDPNMIEAMPARDVPMEVKGGEAKLVAEDFPLGKPGYHDDNLTVEGLNWSGKAAGNNCRISFPIKLKPWREYHVSVKIKTKDFHGQAEIKVLTPNAGMDIQGNYLGAESTQDWKEHHVTFNSLNNTDVTLYFGTWGGKGELNWKDAKLEEVAFVNLVRRPGAPLVVTNEKGETLTEGKDYENLVDPLMGTKPWNGCYDQYHMPPVLKTKLPDGTKLKVSFHHVKLYFDNQAMLCPSEPKSYEMLKDNAMQVHKAFGAKRYFMSFDEIRVLNWCDACQKRHLDSGPLLADMAKKCVAIMKDVAPDAKLLTWNDMFDPFHNAHKDYTLVRGDLTGSWEGLDKNVTIVHWLYDSRDKSIPFFTEKGYPLLIAGYYDEPGWEDHTKIWLESAKKAKAKLQGAMFTTWSSNYTDIEKFIKVVNAVYPK